MLYGHSHLDTAFFPRDRRWRGLRLRALLVAALVAFCGGLWGGAAVAQTSVSAIEAALKTDAAELGAGTGNPTTILYNIDQLIRQDYYIQGAVLVDAHLTGGDFRALCQMAHDPSIPHPAIGAVGSIDWYIETQDPANWSFYKGMCEDPNTVAAWYGTATTPPATIAEKAGIAYVVLYNAGINGHRASRKDAGGEFLNYVGVIELSWTEFSKLGDFLSDTFPEAYYWYGAYLGSMWSPVPMEPLPGDPQDYSGDLPPTVDPPDDFECLDLGGATHKC
jgi:hypothetical protein